MYVRGLPDDGLVEAFKQGGWHHYGWGQERHIKADIYDALTFNTEATGHWDKTPKLGRWPRPTTTPDANEAPKPPATVAALYGRVQAQRAQK